MKRVLSILRSPGSVASLPANLTQTLKAQFANRMHFLTSGGVMVCRVAEIPSLRLKKGALELTLFSLPSEPPRIARMASANLPARQWRYGSLWRPVSTSGNSSSQLVRVFADRIIVEGSVTEFEKIYLRTRMSVSIPHISGPTPLTSSPAPLELGPSI